MSTSTLGVGRFVSWTGGCLLIGRSLSIIPEHAHYAIQIAFGATPGIRFRTREQWTEYSGAIIPSRQPHAMDATGVAETAILFVEPETPQGCALARRYLQQGIARIPDAQLEAAAPTLFSAARDGRDDLLIETCQRMVQALTGDVPLPVITDERVVRAIAYINGNLHAPLTLDMVAGEACLSPSRFRHLFVAETGMALRPYLLWRRFVHVWELLAGGTSLSTAAHEAGFADAAHLSRTSRSMFGFPPSALHIERPVSAPVVRHWPTVPSHAAATRATIQPLRTIRTGMLSLT
jgi:AraC family transcriptional regulator